MAFALKIFTLSFIWTTGFAAQAPDPELDSLKKEYFTRHYVPYDSFSNETRVLNAALHRSEYPVLPLSHLWKRNEDGLQVFRHKDTPRLMNLLTFGEGAPQKPFKTDAPGETYDAGHCIDHAITPNEILNFYRKSSAHHPANLIPEPPRGYGIKIRPDLVTEFRARGHSYSQLALYAPSDTLKYTRTPWVTAIPQGVLLFEHAWNKARNTWYISSGWRVPWDDYDLQYNPSGRGALIRLRGHHLLRQSGDKRDEPIFKDHQKQKPDYVSYAFNDLAEDFDAFLGWRLEEPLDPFSRYRLEVLSDQEIVLDKIPFLLGHMLKEKRRDEASYWTKRLIEQGAFLENHEVKEIFINKDSLKPLLKIIRDQEDASLEILEDYICQQSSSEARVKGLAQRPVSPEGAAQEPITPIKQEVQPAFLTPSRQITIPLGKNKGSPPSLKDLGPRTPLELFFEKNGEGVINQQHKGQISRFMNSFLTINKGDPLREVPYVQLTGCADLVSDNLRKTLKKRFGDRLRDFPQP